MPQVTTSHTIVTLSGQAPKLSAEKGIFMTQATRHQPKENKAAFQRHKLFHPDAEMRGQRPRMHAWHQPPKEPQSLTPGGTKEAGEGGRSGERGRPPL